MHLPLPTCTHFAFTSKYFIPHIISLLIKSYQIQYSITRQILSYSISIFILFVIFLSCIFENNSLFRLIISFLILSFTFGDGIKLKIIFTASLSVLICVTFVFFLVFASNQSIIMYDMISYINEYIYLSFNIIWAIAIFYQ